VTFRFGGRSAIGTIIACSRGVFIEKSPNEGKRISENIATVRGVAFARPPIRSRKSNRKPPSETVGRIPRDCLKNFQSRGALREIKPAWGA